MFDTLAREREEFENLLALEQSYPELRAMVTPASFIWIEGEGSPLLNTVKSKMITSERSQELPSVKAGSFLQPYLGKRFLQRASVVART